ncbi:MAG: enoyl-CoA hydratase-related protein, partial [Alphaproteobacteria bacterium]|nr:enoyl-CoA hydratase-related protein [Alphaproteobacteria bacterium]
METLRYEVDGDGIATITIDVPGKSMNVINAKLMEELDGVIDKVAGDDAVKGAIVTSGKASGFGAGADLDMMGSQAGAAATPTDVFENSMSLSRTLRKLETSGKPWAAALNGLAMGGMLEIALACHYRVSADNPKIQYGLPEVKVGLLPGAGGTQRLPRLMGVQASLPYLLQGKSMSPKEALAATVVNEVVPAE